MHVPMILEDGDRPEDKPDRLIGSGTAMQAVCKQIGRVAPQDVNVLILGESGTGKELVSRAIYHHSRRSRATFLAINCAAIPEPLLESELFGHEQGAFTGADRRRIGKFEQVARRHAASRRNRRHGPADPGQDSAAAARGALSSGWAAANRSRPTSASSPLPTRTSTR